MANKFPRPAAQAQAPQMTEEEKKAQVARFLQQKKEGFAINILCNMVHGAIQNKDTTNVACKHLVDLSVEMADQLMDKLYPIKEDNNGKQD